jgi:sugar phosphate isomerase/epimerase
LARTRGSTLKESELNMPLDWLEAEWTMWSGTIGEEPLEARIDATRQAGYRSLSIAPSEVEVRETAGMTPAGLAKLATGRGVRLNVLDPIATWVPTSATKWRPATFSVDEVLRMSEGLAVESITAVAVRSRGRSLDDYVGFFASLCDRAAEQNLRIQLEFVPGSGVPDVRMAWDIVRLADRPNGGILLDSWHFFRGSPDFDVLSAIPGDRIFEVQISDGGPLQGTMMEDMYRRRSLPGDGDFDLGRLLTTLAEIGGLRRIGPEVLSDELHLLAPNEAALSAAGALDRCLERALGKTPPTPNAPY